MRLLKISQEENLITPNILDVKEKVGREEELWLAERESKRKGR